MTDNQKVMNKYHIKQLKNQLFKHFFVCPYNSLFVRFIQLLKKTLFLHPNQES